MAGVWASSCTSGDEAMAVPEASDKVIAWQPVHGGQTRVQLFEPNNTAFYDEEAGGGEFTVDAYYDSGNTALRYIGNGRVWYRGDEKVETETGAKDWINVDESGNLTDYYWPNEGALNFFAYMPSKKFMDGHTDKKTYVTLGGYTDTYGQQFSCDLPATNNVLDSDGETVVLDYDANMIEFIYAYTPSQTLADAVAGSDGVKRTPLKFVHPFSLVCFQLGDGSYRMTIENITLGNLHLKGEFSTGQTCTAEGFGTWIPNENEDPANTTYTANINKRIPNDVNYNTVFGGPYVMMPQDLTGVTLTLNATRDLLSTEEEDTSTDVEETVNLTGTWAPGKRYTYTLMHGDNNEEIYFNVLVEDWEYVEYRNEIDVE